jgi:hypothetical protein
VCAPTSVFRISEERAEAGSIRTDRQPCISVVTAFARYRFINIADPYLAERVVIAKEPPQKIFDMPMSSLNACLREPLFDPQVVKE